ncbi:MAG TPA: hypothetical protein VMR52_12980, partial [Dehalococcoidia bacterium]|nr:hypothetical protein [Dehalococcoidia bacterium]
MTPEVNTAVAEAPVPAPAYSDEEYDPDAPPERTPFGFTGRLTKSVRCDNIDEATAEGFGENYQKYMEQAGRPLDTPVWYLQAVALDGQRDDGTEFIQSDMLTLKDKNGRWLTEGMAPDLVAQQFREQSGGLT